MTELITAAAIGASFVLISDKVKSKLLDMASHKRDRRKTV